MEKKKTLNNSSFRWGYDPITNNYQSEVRTYFDKSLITSKEERTIKQAEYLKRIKCYIV